MHTVGSHYSYYGKCTSLLSETPIRAHLQRQTDFISTYYALLTHKWGCKFVTLSEQFTGHKKQL
uniref:Uncharacterized protein n=2 Tax=Vibrio TaxID=662 RepID=A0A0H3ZU84_9VIBR|nr:hypothetical protein [Vibrio tasmaniensis]AKN40287.1 hypothetical protein [Vibrio sp. ZF_6]